MNFVKKATVQMLVSFSQHSAKIVLIELTVASTVLFMKLFVPCFIDAEGGTLLYKQLGLS